MDKRSNSNAEDFPNFLRSSFSSPSTSGILREQLLTETAQSSSVAPTSSIKSVSFAEDHIQRWSSPHNTLDSKLSQQQRQQSVEYPSHDESNSLQIELRQLREENSILKTQLANAHNDLDYYHQKSFDLDLLSTKLAAERKALDSMRKASISKKKDSKERELLSKTTELVKVLETRVRDLQTQLTESEKAKVFYYQEHQRVLKQRDTLLRRMNEVASTSPHASDHSKSQIAVSNKTLVFVPPVVPALENDRATDNRPLVTEGSMAADSAVLPPPRFDSGGSNGLAQSTVSATLPSDNRGLSTAVFPREIITDSNISHDEAVRDVNRDEPPAPSLPLTSTLLEASLSDSHSREDRGYVDNSTVGNPSSAARPGTLSFQDRMASVKKRLAEGGSGAISSLAKPTLLTGTRKS